MRIGFHASHEQWPPSKLLSFVQRAESAGFDGAMCSDHFAPWLPEQGQSGFAWSWLGAALAATGLSFGTVCAPGQRYHPAVIAQASATLAEMFPGRFWLSVGSGEALNEHITGEAWPAKPLRNARLKASVEAMRALWNGETVTSNELIRMHEARLWTRAENPPLVVGAALSPETAAWMGPWVDGLITAGKEPESLKRILSAFRAGGGIGKPVFLQLAVSYARTDQVAVEAAHREWRQCVLSPQQLSDLETPESFAAASREASLDDVRDKLAVSSSVAQHIEWLEAYRELGFDAVYVHQIGRNMEEFIDVYGSEVLPRFAVRRE
jgi:coenzyme F420-dependent glucose-6-phosphate dehydrogenase